MSRCRSFVLSIADDEADKECGRRLAAWANLGDVRLACPAFAPPSRPQRVRDALGVVVLANTRAAASPQVKAEVDAAARAGLPVVLFPADQGADLSPWGGIPGARVIDPTLHDPERLERLLEVLRGIGRRRPSSVLLLALLLPLGLAALAWAGIAFAGSGAAVAAKPTTPAPRLEGLPQPYCFPDDLRRAVLQVGGAFTLTDEAGRVWAGDASDADHLADAVEERLRDGWHSPLTLRLDGDHTSRYMIGPPIPEGVEYPVPGFAVEEPRDGPPTATARRRRDGALLHVVLVSPTRCWIFDQRLVTVGGYGRFLSDPRLETVIDPVLDEASLPRGIRTDLTRGARFDVGTTEELALQIEQGPLGGPSGYGFDYLEAAEVLYPGIADTQLLPRIGVCPIEVLCYARWLGSDEGAAWAPLAAEIANRYPVSPAPPVEEYVRSRAGVWRQTGGAPVDDLLDRRITGFRLFLEVTP